MKHFSKLLLPPSGRSSLHATIEKAANALTNNLLKCFIVIMIR